jgi:hypothetical protein
MAKKKSVTRQRRPVAPRNEFHGKPVFDADQPLTLQIGRADVRGAKIKSPDHCAAARALCRQDDVIEAHVFREVTLIVRKDRCERYITPQLLRNETVMYDKTGRFDEGEYYLNPPMGQRKLGADKRAHTRGGGADKRRATPVVLTDVRPHAPSNYKSSQ